MSDPAELTLLEAAAAIGAGELSPVELTEHYLARTERTGPRSTPTSPSRPRRRPRSARSTAYRWA
jgi:Asp-tRNA(Asn)/Glu-tRNA(Gln) amidotransferase A subunit family amidase